MSRSRVNGVLLLLVLGLALLVWRSAREPQITAPTPLTQLLPEQVASIRISNQRGAEISLQREANRWRMLEPYPVEANETLIRRLLEIAAAPVFTQFTTAQNRLAEFGMAPPAAIVHLNQLELRVGGTDPINHYRYIGIGDRLYLIKDLFPHLLLAAAETYVSPKLLPQNAELDLIQTAEWRLARMPDGPQVWHLSPADTASSMDRLIEKVDEWKYAEAQRVIKPPPGTVTDARVEVRLRGSDATAITFSVFKLQQSTLLLREDLGLAYDLPRIEALLAAPAAPKMRP